MEEEMRREEEHEVWDYDMDELFKDMMFDIEDYCHDGRIGKKTDRELERRQDTLLLGLFNCLLSLHAFPHMSLILLT